MAKTCRSCKRLNPDEAIYCYFDGTALDGQTVQAASAGTPQGFPYPFLLPNKRACHNFDELVTACQDDWAAALDALQYGSFLIFFGTIGRPDLARMADEAGRFPDRDRGLDQLLSQLPSKTLEQPRLAVLTRELQIGPIAPGQTGQGEVRLRNQGRRLLHGWITSDVGWLMLGAPPGAQAKMFQLTQDLSIPVLVRGKLLRASNKPLEAKLTIESNDGSIETVVVRVHIPVKPFPEGVLAGAVNPRQLALKAKAAPQQAALLFEKGAVAQWYRVNGWTYPVRVPAASGLGAIQQYFEALGLVPAPAVDINAKEINLTVPAGGSSQHLLMVRTKESRPVWAYGTSNQPWLGIGKATLAGRVATLPVLVRQVPGRPGDKLTGQITVVANGNQQFKIPITVTVAAGPVSTPAAAPMVRSNKVTPKPQVGGAPAQSNARPLAGAPTPGKLPLPPR